MLILDVGCGNKKYKPEIGQDKVIGIDIVKLQGVDVVHNLNKTPWPFKNNQFDFIYCSHVIEHLDNTLEIFEEIWRIGKPGAFVEIKVPYFSNYRAFSDPTHKKFFTALTFEYFTKDSDHSYYTKARLEIIERKLIFDSSRPLLSKFFDLFLNLNVRFYERFLCWIFPAGEIYVKLKIIK